MMVLAVEVVAFAQINPFFASGVLVADLKPDRAARVKRFSLLARSGPEVVAGAIGQSPELITDI